MKYLAIITSFISVCSMFSLTHAYIKQNHYLPRSSKLFNVKNTEYGPLESIPISELYKNMNAHTIKNIYFSNDLKNVFFVENTGTKVSGVVNSNPGLTDNIIDVATKNDVKTVILDKPMNFLENGSHLAEGVLNFAILSIGISIVFNIFSAFFMRPRGIGGNSGGNSSRGGKNQNPFSSMMPPGMQSGSTDKIIDVSVLNTTLADWAGSPEVVEECAEIVSYIKNASIYKAAGAQIPKGILLDGPPGTGKTLLAKAIAGETNATFLSISGSEFVELFVGMGAAKVRSLFEDAREYAPSIIFIDEIDAVGKKRSASNSMNPNDEREQTLNQLLSEMDGFLPNTDVIVIAATNRRDVLDDALLRPGRFDRLIYVPLPDRSSRESILKLYLKNKKTTDDIDIKFLSENTGGFSGAQIKNLLNEAAIFAARKGNDTITKQDIESALEKIIVGITKKVDTRSDSSKKRIAIHEIGHATLAAYFYEDFELKKVSMKSTYNGVGGYTLFNELPDVQESGLYTKDSLMKRIVVALGGKAAETLEYGEEYVSVGSSEDLKQANSLAREMIETYGMGKHLEVFSRAKTNDIFNKYSEKTLGSLDEEVFAIVQECYDWAKMILIEKKQETEFLYHMLLERRELDGHIVSDLIGRK